jgi:serine/threonine protein kinase
MNGSGDLETTLSMRKPQCEPPSVPALVDFEVVRFLGGGGMGVVYEGRHVLGRRVALKFRRRGAMQRDDARVRLLREAAAMARLRHRNVVSLFEVGIAGDEVFIAMDLVDGGTLRDWMQEPHEWREVVDMFIAFGRGLSRAHSLGLVHRDVNPSNVFLDRTGTPKLGDFGLAIDAGDPLEDGLVLGTPGYLAPEQTRGGHADAQSDQYAFCVSLHEALAGRRPDLAGAELAVPRPLREILTRGLAAPPSERFPSMKVLLAALERTRRSWSRRWVTAICRAGDASTTITCAA